MKNRLVISFFIHFLLGILFVFPVNSAESIEEFTFISESVSFFGKEKQAEPSKASKNHRFLSSIENPFNCLLTDYICETEPCSEFSFKRSQQIVDISFLTSLRSIVILC